MKQEIYVKNMKAIKDVLSPKKFRSAAVYVVNELGKKSKKESVSKIRSTYNIGASRVKQNVVLDRANKNQANIRSSVEYKGETPGLHHYKAIQYRGGYAIKRMATGFKTVKTKRRFKPKLTVAVFKGKGGRKVVKKSFLMLTKTGGAVVLKREGKHLRKLYGPSLRGEMKSTGGAKWIYSNVVKPNIDTIAKRAVRRYVSKYAKV